MLVFGMLKISSNSSGWIAEFFYFLVQFLSIKLLISSLIILLTNWDMRWGDGLKIWKNDGIYSSLGKWFYFSKTK